MPGREQIIAWQSSLSSKGDLGNEINAPGNNNVLRRPMRNGSGSSVQIRPIKYEDLPEVAMLHREVFESYFTTHMGQGFLETFYGEFIGKEDATGIVALDGKTVIGFTFGLVNPGAFYARFYRRYFSELIIMFGRAALTSPVIRKSIASRLGHVSYAIRSKFQRIFGPPTYIVNSNSSARLLSIGVAPGFRGRGIAGDLVCHLFEWFRDNRVDWVGLSVLASNTRAIGFYRKTGWWHERTIGSGAYFYKSTAKETSTAHAAELARIRAEYARRAADAELLTRYSRLNLSNLFALHGRERVLIKLLATEGLISFSDLRVLDVGCGSGGDLAQWISYGAVARNLHGIDLLAPRLTMAHDRNSRFQLLQADAAFLPYASATFDIVAQSTVFSSVLDPLLRRRMAADMLRVLKSGGCIFWYDFFLNPMNPQTRGIRSREIRELFPGCRFRFRRVTLAPPVARLVVPISVLVGSLLEAIPLLRTHYLVSIRKAEVPKS